MTLTSLALLMPALLYLLAALFQQQGGWPLTRVLVTLALLASAAPPAALALTGATALPWLSHTPLTLIMGLLISIMALLVVTYSVNYLAGDPVVPRYRRWLLLCLAGVSLVVISNHLLMLWLAWTAVSVSLHQLLVSYPDRFRAVLAAHKKFIFARLAESCLLAASVLLYQHHGTFQIDTIMSRYPASDALSAAEQAAAALLVLAALIKCAQLPVHGWLIQVVEAPTPVSALLHAGVINMGGFLMILVAPLMAQAHPARWLLLVVAGLTTVLAALVMMTRISLKVRLAWSTSAQMGLMLLECALGLHELALLHLLAHSCYKAHAFLSSGTAVQAMVARQLAPVSAPGMGQWLAYLVLATGLVGLTLAALHQLAGIELSAPELALWLLFTLALSLWLPAQAGQRLASTLLAPVLLLAYLAQKWLLSQALPDVADAGLAAALWTTLLCVMLMTGYGMLVMHQTALGFRWRQWLFAGLYLDEWVTRMTLRIWPVRLPLPASRKQAPASLFSDSHRSSHEHLA